MSKSVYTISFLRLFCSFDLFSNPFKNITPNYCLNYYRLIVNLEIHILSFTSLFSKIFLDYPRSYDFGFPFNFCSQFIHTQKKLLGFRLR